MLWASRYIQRVELIDPQWLVDQGVRFVLVDRDNTLVPRDTKEAPPSVFAWIHRLKDAGLDVVLFSNNFHTKQVQATGKALHIPAIDHAMKPFPPQVLRAMASRGYKREETIMIGDQIFTDILAANLSGVRSILVRPQSRRDLWYTQISRVFEYLLLLGKHFEGE